jgi:hypothetical protein
MGKDSIKYIALLYIAALTVAVGYYCFGRISHVDAEVMGVVLSANPTSLENTPESFVARLSWGRTGMLYVLAFILASFVIAFEIVERGKKWKVMAGVGWLLLATVVILVLLAVGIFQSNPLAVDGTHGLVTDAVRRLDLSEWMLDHSAAPGIVIGLMLLYLAHLTIEAMHADSADELRECATGIRRATYAAAAVLATAVLHANALHLLPVSLLPPATTDLEKAVVESIKQVAATYSVAQGTVWTLLLMAVYIPVALSVERRVVVLTDADLIGQNSTESMQRLRSWLKDTKRIGHSPPFGALLSTDEIRELQRTISGVELTVTDLVFENRVLTGALVAVPGPSTLSHKARREWAEKHGFDRSLYQQLTTVAAVLAPFLTGSAMLEFIDAIGR